MYLNVGVKDLINLKSKRVSFNEILITKQDVIRISKLMYYLTFRKIFVIDSIRLDQFTKHQQNEISLIFLEYYEYIVLKSGIQYLNKHKMLNMFKESEELTGILIRAINKNVSPARNGINITDISTDDLNLLMLNWFSKINRNFRSIEKFILPTTNLFDINLNAGSFDKIVDPIEFLSKTFDAFIRIGKGSIPFSDDFGSNIKASIQTKSDYFTKKIIVEELTDFVNQLTSFHNDTFTLENIEYITSSTLVAERLAVIITISINSIQEIKFKIN